MLDQPRKKGLGWVTAAAAASAAAGWVVFSPMRAAFFRHDDFGWLRVAQGWAVAGKLWPVLSMGHAGFTVLYNFIYYACYLIGGLEPRIYWDVLIAAHAINCALVAWIAFALTECPVAAGGAGVLFALLFTHHEAVGWLGGGLHVFALVFMLLSLLAWIDWRRGGSGVSLAAAMLFGAAALLTKASAVPLVLLVGLWEMLMAPRPRLSAMAWWLLPYGATFALRAAYPPSHYVVRPGAGTYWPGLHVLTNLALCVPQMLVPDLRFINYAAMLHANLPAVLASGVIALSLLAIAGIFVLSIWLLLRGDRLTKFSVAWCYVAFLPAALFRYDYAMAPRYLYIPSVGLCLLAGHGFSRLVYRLDRQRAAVAMAGFVALVAVYNIPPLVVMESHRLRDSAVRRMAIYEGIQALRRLPRGARACIYGLPKPFADVAEGLQVFSRGQMKARWIDSPSVQYSDEHWLIYSPKGRLVEVLSPTWDEGTRRKPG